MTPHRYETVCPVATTHSNEGLNQMTYNRCIGTRYCTNCPYGTPLQVVQYQGYASSSTPALLKTVWHGFEPRRDGSSRGVIEKCSMCVQRIQEGKLEAKKQGAPLLMERFKPLRRGVPYNAITFGDLNDETSEVKTNSLNNRSTTPWKGGHSNCLLHDESAEH